MAVNGKTSLRVLLVEDNVDDEILMVRALKRGGFDVLCHRVDTEAGLLVALDEMWDICICDYKMPNLIPERVLDIIRQKGIPFILVSGLVSEEIALGILKAGAGDFIAKSNFSRLPLAVLREVRRSTEAVQHRLDMGRSYDMTIQAWGQALELRDPGTQGHTIRVTDMTLRLARREGIVGEDFLNIQRGALLHDIGKMGIPDRILLKPDRLTDDEMDVMKTHPKLANDMLWPIPFLRPALDIPYCHHERWDGAGYPRGLKGEEIPVAARLFSVVDVYDALTSGRPYREGWSHERTMTHIQLESGIAFDSAIVERFVDMMKGA